MIAQIIVKKKSNKQPLDYTIKDNEQEILNSLVEVPFRNSKSLGIVVCTKKSSKFNLKEIKRPISNGPIITSLQLELARKICEKSFCDLSDSLFSFIPIMNISDLKSIGGVGKISLGKKPGAVFYLGPEEQRIQFFCQTADFKKRQNILVLPTIEKVEKAAKFIKKLNSNAEVFPFHSKIESKVKAKIWQSLLNGKNITIVGTRQSLLLPLTRPGLIHLDDPTNFAYHEDQAPYYNAYDIARLLWKITRCNLAVSADAVDMFSFVLLKRKIFRLVESRDQIKFSVLKSWNFELKNPAFTDLILKNLKDKKRICLVGNWQNKVRYFCTDCAKTIFCPKCKNNSFYENSPLCPNCQNNISVSLCPFCQSAKIKIIGMRPNDLKADLKKLFPQKENQISTNPSSTKQLVICSISEFQQLAPPFDLAIFPEFDTLLNTPFFDYRSRIFRLIYSLRSLSIQNVILCGDSLEENKFVQFIVKNDWQDFLKNELLERKQLSLPPFSIAVKIVAKTSSDKAALLEIDKLLEKLPLLKTVSSTQITKISDGVKAVVFAVVLNESWDSFREDALSKLTKSIHLEVGPVEFS
jgi:primosomal protein N'